MDCKVECDDSEVYLWVALFLFFFFCVLASIYSDLRTITSKRQNGDPHKHGDPHRNGYLLVVELHIYVVIAVILLLFQSVVIFFFFFFSFFFFFWSSFSVVFICGEFLLLSGHSPRSTMHCYL